MLPARHLAARLLIPAVVAVASAATAGWTSPAAAAPLSPAVASKLDPALASWAAGGAEARHLWVTFADKTPEGPAGIAARLAAADAGLTPRARARRLRARVWPLVDERDLPVAAEYLDALRSLGFSPFAASRWLNRAAIRATPDRIETLARLPYVAGISAVARAAPARRTEPHGGVVTSPARAAAGVRDGSRPGAPTGDATSGRAESHGAPAGAGFAEGQLAQVGLPALHDAGYTGAGLLVAIMDQGFNFFWKHEALRDRVFPPGHMRDFVEGDTVVADSTDLLNQRHGVWVLGILGGDLPGVYRGSAWGATFALARSEVGATETPAEMLYWAQAAEWADSLGADLIASSVGYNVFDSPFPDIGPGEMDGKTTDISRAAQVAASKGILLVNSIGNGGFGPLPRIAAPADVNGDSLIAVGAVDTFGNVSSFSSRGPTSDGRIKPDLVARGTRAWLVQGTGLPNSYELRDGTSFAAPLVAGLAACVLQARPGLTPVEVIRALRETASAMCAPDLNQGWGIPWGPAALTWMPGPTGTSGPPAGYLDLENEGALPVRPAVAPLRLRFGLGPRLGERADARLRVFDAQGRLIRGLFYGSLTCGRWQAVEWNGRDQEDRRVRPGVYLVHFDSEGRTRSLRVVLIE